MPMLDVERLTAMFDHFDREVFRLENLDSYNTEHEAEQVRRYLAGEPYRVPGDMGWNEQMAAQVRAGKKWGKVHVLRDPTSPYFRYACEWAWPTSTQYGQRIRILDLSARPASDRLTGTDFWMIDDTVVVMHYDQHQRFVGAHLAGPDESSRLRRDRATAEQQSVPYEQWWQAHPEHWRSSWLRS
ncbi:DUF6879 family protein [Actinomadura rupiterrae]|uniref:DUF6879 family protein n=1 Tax=Actinomadura rupiterrae TaxID=559627 RepID=UPI0020A532A5|nr:DUF6879 family protein [Actinomadura rupiterrae]MCP2341227.1 hypothetical protein [Actinomadura rupiterrae]